MEYLDFLILRDLEFSDIIFSDAVRNERIKELENVGYLKNGKLTELSKKTLSEYKVDNAIILAAGLSSRFAPLSYEKPKGLTTVRGEILIERQIRQLHEVGISDITVVVGYKAEEFEYLKEKYSIEIVKNIEYASRNNHASLFLVADRLKNTYICSSDNYFEENPFHSYEWMAGYSTQYISGPTEEWCIKTDENRNISGIQVGGSDAWIMIGPAYFDRKFSEKFKKILYKEYPLETTKDKLWETLYVEHISELPMRANYVNPPIIKEFDYIDEAIAFDPHLLDHVDSGIIDRIVKTLGCCRTEIHELYPLKAGLTNLSCHFRVGDQEYVYRHPGIGTELLVDRTAEFQALDLAKRIGIDKTFLAGDPTEGWKISYYIKNSRQLDVFDAHQRKLALQKLRSLHENKGTLGRKFSFLDEAKRYEKQFKPDYLSNISGYYELRNKIAKLEKLDPQKGLKHCITHNDFFPLNILVAEEQEMHLIDWEYAGMGDYANDYGTFVVTSRLDDELAEQALIEYFDRSPTWNEKVHNAIYVAYASWCWYLWTLLKEMEGDCVGDWREVYRKYALHYCQKIEGLFKEKK